VMNRIGFDCLMKGERSSLLSSAALCLGGGGETSGCMGVLVGVCKGREGGEWLVKAVDSPLDGATFRFPAEGPVLFEFKRNLREG
jgi:hypothetical protein